MGAAGVGAECVIADASIVFADCVANQRINAIGSVFAAVDIVFEGINAAGGVAVAVGIA